MEQLSFFKDDSQPDMTLTQLADWYFAHYAENNLKAVTRENYRYITDRFLLPSLGVIRLEHFNNRMLTQWFSELPVSPAYCRNIYTVLRSMFTVAIHNGFVERHPCDYVVLPRVPVDAEERKPRLTEEDAQELFRMTEKFTWFNSVVRFLLLTGVRSGEAFGLRWVDVDFEKHFIHIRRNLTNVRSKHWLDTPKTKNSIRQIYMSEEVEALLLQQKKGQELWIENAGGLENFPHPEIVFTTPKGNFIDHNYTERKFKQFVADTSFSDITLHSLRHANATLMLAAGVDLKVVSALLGHSSISTTANLYTEVLDSTKAEAAMKISMQLGQTEKIP